MTEEMPQITFSLIVGTLGRNDDLKRFLDALCQQTESSFELLLIDQSAGQLDLSLLNDVRFPVQRITSEPGLSKIRNIGLKSVRGKIVAFPDDDCFYPPSLLKSLEDEFSSHPEYDGISVKVTDKDGRFSAGYMASRPFRITPRNIWRSAVSTSLFFRKTAVDGVFFDERLGIGSHTPFQSGEETDFCLRLISCGKNLHYLPQYTVYHPIFSGPYSPGRAFGYGMGMGRVLRRHHYSVWYLFRFAFYQFCQSLRYLLYCRFSRAYFHFFMGIGRCTGYFSGKE